MPKRKTFYICIFALSVVMAFYLSVSWVFSSMILIAKRDTAQLNEIIETSNNPPQGLSVFTLRNDQEELISFWVRTPEDHNQCAIIFSHGWGSSRVKLNSFENVLADKRCLHILYDLRGHATHPDRFSSGGIIEQSDLAFIHAFVKNYYSFNDNQIGWFGVSLGGSFNLMAASKIKPAFVIADSPFESWRKAIFERGEEMYGAWVHSFEPGVRFVIWLRAGFDYRESNVLKHAGFIRSPVLIIHSASDDETNPEQSKHIFNALRGKKNVLHITGWGSEHAKDAFNFPDAYQALALGFIDTYVSGFGLDEPK